jgi:hypothetical protein
MQDEIWSFSNENMNASGESAGLNGPDKFLKVVEEKIWLFFFKHFHR